MNSASVDELAVAHLHHLDLARKDELRERVRREVVRIVARLRQNELVELAGLEAQPVRHEDVLAGLAELDRDLDRRLPRQVAGGAGATRDGGSCNKRREDRSRHPS